MASGSAWESGWGLGSQLAEHRLAHKQAMEDLQFQDKHNEIQGLINNQENRAAAIATEKGTDSPEYLKARNDLSGLLQNRTALWGQVKHPSKLMEYASKLGRDLHFPVKAQPIPVAPPVVTQTPAMQLGGTSVPAGPAYQVQGPQTPAQERAQKEANMILSAGPKTPTEIEGIRGQQQLARMQATIKNLDTLFPSAPPEVKTKWLNELAQQATGAKIVPEKYFTQLATTKDEQGKEHYWRVPMDPTAQPEEVDFKGQNIVPKPTAQKPKKGLKYDPGTGEVVDQDTGKRYSIRDVAKPDTPVIVRRMFEDAKAIMDQKQRNALQLATQRGASYSEFRFGAFMDPQNPRRVIVTTNIDAHNRGLQPSTSPEGRAVSGILSSATYGKIADEMVAYGTAYQHADLLKEAAVALNNGDTVALNRIKNDISYQLGDPSVTTFGAIAEAYTREVNNAISHGHLTEAELEKVGGTIPKDASPQQILGAVTAFQNLMQSKMNIRRKQVNDGLQGIPYMGPPASWGGGANVPTAGIKVKTPDGHVHIFPDQASADRFKKAAGIP